jgi:hypothetical protein
MSERPQRDPLHPLSVPPFKPRTRHELITAWEDLSGLLMEIIGMNQDSNRRVKVVTWFIFFCCFISCGTSVAAMFSTMETQRKLRLLEVSIQYIDLSCVKEVPGAVPLPKEGE